MQQWLPMAGLTALPSDEIHVWLAAIDQPAAVFAEFQSSFTSAEKERLERFKDDNARRQFLVGRGVLRKLLAAYIGADPSSIHFEFTLRGKPALSPVHRENIQFNLSHSGKYVLFSFGRGRSIGIDLEKVTPMEEMDAIVEKFFSPAEAICMNSNPARKQTVFFECWTRKEAVLKCIGTGIGDESVELEKFPGTVCRLAPAHGYIGALAVDGSPFLLRSFSWVYGVPARESCCYPERRCRGNKGDDLRVYTHRDAASPEYIRSTFER